MVVEGGEWWWMVVDDVGWLWMVVDGGGRWWMMVSGDGWWRIVVDGGWRWTALACLLLCLLAACCAGVTQACSCASLTDGLLAKTVAE